MCSCGFFSIISIILIISFYNIIDGISKKQVNIFIRKHRHLTKIELLLLKNDLRKKKITLRNESELLAINILLKQK